MISLGSITEFFTNTGQLRLSQRKTLAALVWAVLYEPLLGIAKIGRHLAMANTTTAKHAIQRVDRFVGNLRINMEVAQGDLIRRVVGTATRVFLTLDWTEPNDGVHQILTCNLRAHGRALPLAWTTVRKDALKDRTRWYEQQLCGRVAALVPKACQVILLADRGFATVEFFRFLDTLGWDWIIRSKGSVSVQHLGQWILLVLSPAFTQSMGISSYRRSLGQPRPARGDYPEILYGKRATGGSYRGGGWSMRSWCVPTRDS